MEVKRPPIPKSFRSKFFDNLKQVPPHVFFKILGTVFFLSPWLIYYLSVSWLKLLKWKKAKTCRNFIHRQKLAFPEIEESTLKVSSLAGGVSNASHIWKVKTKSGNEVRFFAKIFIPSGSIWIKQMSLVSPFPPIYGIHTSERFIVDMVSRVQLGDRNIPVPKLVAYDPVQKVIVTEYLEGENVDAALRRIDTQGSYDANDEEMIKQCGVLLAKIHQAGFSLIDCQPANCIWVESEKKVYFTDLEFCTREEWRLWDIGFFLCCLTLRLESPLKKRLKNCLIESYQKERHITLSQIRGTRRLLSKYLPVLTTILDLRQYTAEELFGEALSR